MSEKRVVVKVENLTKSFRIPLEASSGIKQKIINTIKGRKGYREFTPLNDISFEIEEGDFFGIVGRNGSGKSTLLKTLAGIYSPDKGAVTVNGKLVPFIELGVGFNPELSGRENVFLNGALLGFSHKEMEDMYDDIVDFAELHNFMEERLKNYSSGMQVRLAFSIAIRAEGDILLLDEVLAVGDEAFQRKCFNYFAQLKKEKRTVVLVTHDMSSVQRFCNRAMLIDKGRVKIIGDTTSVSNEYQVLNMPKAESGNDETVVAGVEDTADKATNLGEVVTITTDGSGSTKRVFTPKDDSIRINSVIAMYQDIDDAFFGVTVKSEDGTPVFWYTTEYPHESIDKIKKHKKITIDLNIQNIFGDGEYEIDIAIKSNDRSKEYVVLSGNHSFTVAGHGQYGWMLHPDVDLTIN